MYKRYITVYRHLDTGNLRVSEIRATDLKDAKEQAKDQGRYTYEKVVKVFVSDKQ